MRAVEDDEAEAEEEERPSPPLFPPDGGGAFAAKDGGGVAPSPEEGPPKARSPTWAERDAGESVESGVLSEVAAGREDLRRGGIVSRDE